MDSKEKNIKTGDFVWDNGDCVWIDSGDGRFIKHTMWNKKNWISIKRAKDCFFSRRNGYQGKIFFGYSVRVRLFNYDLI